MFVLRSEAMSACKALTGPTVLRTAAAAISCPGRAGRCGLSTAWMGNSSSRVPKGPMADTTRIARPAPIIVAGIRHKQTAAKILASVAEIRDPKERVLAWERAVFGGADERQRLVKLGKHCLTPCRPCAFT